MTQNFDIGIKPKIILMLLALFTSLINLLPNLNTRLETFTMAPSFSPEPRNKRRKINNEENQLPSNGALAITSHKQLHDLLYFRQDKLEALRSEFRPFSSAYYHILMEMQVSTHSRTFYLQYIRQR